MHRRKLLAFLVLTLTLPTTLAHGAETYVHVATIGSLGSGPGQFDTPYDVVVLGERLYVADSHNNRVQVLDLTGTYLLQWGSTGEGNGQFRRNRGIGAPPFGGSEARIYVTDAKNDRVQRFDSEGVHQDTWGSIGDGEQQFFRPRGIDVASDGTIVICDADNHRMKVYSPELSVETIFGTRGEAPGEFVSPVDCSVSPDDRIYVVDTFNQRVQVFDLAGNHHFSFGSRGTGPGQFIAAKGIEVASDGSVFVADTRDTETTVNRVQKFTADGAFLTSFGSDGAGDGEMRFVAGIALDAAGRVYLADSGNHRVTVWQQETVPVERRSISSLKGAYGGR